MTGNVIYFYLKRRKRKKKRIRRKGDSYDGNKEKDTQRIWKIIVIVLKHELPKLKRIRKLFELQMGRKVVSWHVSTCFKNNIS